MFDFQSIQANIANVHQTTNKQISDISKLLQDADKAKLKLISLASSINDIDSDLNVVNKKLVEHDKNVSLSSENYDSLRANIDSIIATVSELEKRLIILENSCNSNNSDLNMNYAIIRLFLNLFQNKLYYKLVYSRACPSEISKRNYTLVDIQLKVESGVISKIVVNQYLKELGFTSALSDWIKYFIDRQNLPLIESVPVEDWYNKDSIIAIIKSEEFDPDDTNNLFKIVDMYTKINN